MNKHEVISFLRRPCSQTLIPLPPSEDLWGIWSGSGLFVPEQIPQIPERDLKGEAGFLSFLSFEEKRR